MKRKAGPNELSDELIDLSPLDLMDGHQREYFLKGVEAGKKMIHYYNRKDWKSKKGKLGKLDEEFIGSIIEKQTNTKG